MDAIENVLWSTGAWKLVPWIIGLGFSLLYYAALVFICFFAPDSECGRVSKQEERIGSWLVTLGMAPLCAGTAITLWYKYFFP